MAESTGFLLFFSLIYTETHFFERIAFPLGGILLGWLMVKLLHRFDWLQAVMPRKLMDGDFSSKEILTARQSYLIFLLVYVAFALGHSRADYVLQRDPVVLSSNQGRLELRLVGNGGSGIYGSLVPAEQIVMIPYSSFERLEAPSRK